ncbi:MAG: hypothetical protein OQK12_04995 [Motiliproteus sp.]|nr:hypothetical protein [Motiliproteus sp.]MCW9052934.1 hypothetical protein [Motiliproteus sp.]
MSNTLSLSTFDKMKEIETDLTKANEQVKSLEIQLAQQVEFNQTQTAVFAKEKERLSHSLNSELVELRTELDSLRHKRQIEALEAIVGSDEDAQAKSDELKKKTEEARELKRQLKELQAFDPKRQKKNLAALKTKGAEQTKLIKDLNAQLKAAKKEVTDLKKERAEDEQKKEQPEDE